MATHPFVAIIIVNWNGWQDTLECLESVLRLDYPAYQVIVCDNGSTDGSLERIQAWAAGRLPAPAANNPTLQYLTDPPIPKPLPITLFSREQAEAGAGHSRDRLLLIENGSNLGFAGGNNVALRNLLVRGDYSFAWLLNNDTVLAPDALSHLVVRMQQKAGAGMCGSTLLFYDQPQLVQGWGGATYNAWVGAIRHLGLFANRWQQVSEEMVERKIDYLIGASLLVSREFLEQVGLMSEEYFLYFEELDWIRRAQARFTLAYASKSIVYHKEGGTAGTKSDPLQKSLLSDYYTLRNRILFTWKHHSWALPLVYLGGIIALANRLRRGQPAHARMIARLLLAGRAGLNRPFIPPVTQ